MGTERDNAVRRNTGGKRESEKATGRERRQDSRTEKRDGVGVSVRLEGMVLQ